MKIIEADSAQLHLEGRAVSPRGWALWGSLFIPGMIALLFLPEEYRFVGFVIWIAIWLALLAVVPRWFGNLIRVTIDSKARQIVWTRDEQVTRTLPFADVQKLDVAQLSTASRPYKTFQLFAALKNGSRITLAVDPAESEIRRALGLARKRMNH